MRHSAELRRCLLALDIEGTRRLWKHVAPHLPQAENDADALASMHMARTAMASMPIKARAYSHRWLIERNLPSQLPDNLKPHAERIYPHVEDAVGIATAVSSPVFRPIAQAICDDMSDTVMDCYGMGDRDPKIVHPRMLETRAKSKKYYADLIADAVAEAKRRQ